MNKIKVLLGSLLGGLSFVPALAFAQQNFNLSNGGISGVLVNISAILTYVVPILIALAIIVFLWGVLKFILSAGNDEKRTEGKNFMIYGIIGIVVMVSIWGIVGFVQRSTGINNAAPAQVPSIPTAR
jgi:hypothetical protein